MNKSPILWHHFCVWKVFIKCLIFDVATASIEAMMIPLDPFVQRSRCLVAWLGWWIVGPWGWAGCLHAPSHYIMRAMSAAVRCRVHCDIKRNIVQECSSRVQVTGCPPPQWTPSKWWLHPGKTLPISAGSWRWPVTSVQGVYNYCTAVQGVQRAHLCHASPWRTDCQSWLSLTPAHIAPVSQVAPTLHCQYWSAQWRDNGGKMKMCPKSSILRGAGGSSR